MPAGQTRPIEERKAELQRKLDELERQQRLAEAQEAANGDHVATGLLSVLKVVDKAMQASDGDEIAGFLLAIRESVCAKLKERGVPL